MMGQYGTADMNDANGHHETYLYLDGDGKTMDDRITEEYNCFKRSAKWELDAIWKALKMMPFLNGPQENARIRAIIIIRAERKNRG